MPEPRTLSVLGSTGSIGTQALDIARARNYRVIGLGAGKNLELLRQQVSEFRPEVVSVHPDIYQQARAELQGVRVTTEPAELATLKVDVVVNALSGLVGLAPTRAALEAGQNLALATKEAMVTAGPLMWHSAQQGGGRMVPIDSEHTGIYQCLVGESLAEVSELILTASGGPFRTGPQDLSHVTPAQALNHPSWKMGPKVTIDSATLMNKGLEVMECAALYGLSLDKVRVVIHPQSVIHAAVRFVDGSLKAQFGAADMRLPIAYALDAAPYGMQHAGDVHAAPRTPAQQQQWPMLGEWHFSEPDFERFPCLGLAYHAGKAGGVQPAALNAADEIAVAAFLAGRIGFMDIARLIEQVLTETPTTPLTWENLYHTDTWARARAQELVGA